MIAINLLSSFRLAYGDQPVVLQHRQIPLIQAVRRRVIGNVRAGGQFQELQRAILNRALPLRGALVSCQ